MRRNKNIMHWAIIPAMAKTINKNIRMLLIWQGLKMGIRCFINATANMAKIFL